MSIEDTKALDLVIDASVGRFSSRLTGIYVRARFPDRSYYESVDIASLDQASLRKWLRSRGGENEWAENVVCLLLGHEPGEPSEQG